jgi:hypothetical protein
MMSINELVGAWYLQLNYPLTFSDANDACKVLGGQLSVIHDKNSSDAVNSLTGLE